MVFHSFNISKVILNSFHCFGSLDYVLKSFVLLVGIFHHRGWENSFFCQIFIWDWFLLMIYLGCWPLMAIRTCIKSGFHDVHVLFYIVIDIVHARCLIKCLLGIFSLGWTPMSTKLWSFSCFLSRNMFGSLVMYFTHLAPYVHFSCLVHALHIATSYTQPPLAHTFATLVMHWSIACFLILACHVYLMLCSILFCLRFKLHFLIHLAPLIHHYRSRAHV